MGKVYPETIQGMSNGDFNSLINLSVVVKDLSMVASNENL